jgi:quercetin dioxygenase-like cupin family protein
MTATEAIEHFEKAYPGKDIIAMPQANPTEIICEIDPTSEHPEVNIAMAAITESKPHYHNKATETYEVVKGDLELFVDGVRMLLQQGSVHIVAPKQVHYAKGNFTIVKVTSRPGWTPEDHILAG